MKNIATAILLSLFCLPSFATNRFQTLYGDMETDRCRAFTTTTDGGYCLIGTNSFGVGTAEITAFRLDNAGSLLWSAKIGTVKNDEATDIHQTSDGGFIVTGNTYGGAMDTAHSDIFVMKMDDQGFPIWSATYGGQSDDVANYILINPTGGYFVLGSTQSFGNVNQSGLLMKISDNGIQEWTVTCNATNINSFQTGLLTTGGKIIAGGSCLLNSGTNTDFLITQIDTSGNIDWGKRIGTSGNDQINTIIPFTGNGFLIAGSAGSTSGTDYDQNITCIESDGTVRWSHNWGKTLNDRATSVHFDGNQNLIIGGSVDIGNPFLELFQMSLFDADTLGNVNWAHTYGDPSVESEGFGSALGTNGGYVSVGYSITSGDPNGDTYFVKTDNAGSSGCYELTLSLSHNSLTLSDSSGVDSQNLIMDENPEFFNWQFFINQFTQNCFNDYISESDLNKTLSIFPNPTSDAFQIQLPESICSVEVYNQLSQLVLKTVSSSEKISINTSAWPEGIFSIRINGKTQGRISVIH